MEFKLKKKLKDIHRIEGRVYQGKEALSLPKEVVLEVIYGGNGNSVGNIIYRLPDDIEPFEVLLPESKAGMKWGNHIDSYKFKVRALTRDIFKERALLEKYRY